jgi:lipoprotein-releasing system permease protein
MAPPFGHFERKLAARYLGARKSDGGVGLIALLSFLCIMLAITAMISIMSIMNGFRGKMVELTLGSDGHMYVSTASPSPTPEQITRLQQRVSQIPGVENAFLFVQADTFIQASGRLAPARVIGITQPDLRAIKLINQNIVVGGLDEFGQGFNGGNKIAIGIHMANGLGLTVGDHMTVYSPIVKVTPFGSRPVFKSYEIAAVFNVGLVTTDSAYIFMPLAQANLFLNEGRQPSDIQLRLDDPDMIRAIEPMIKEAAGEPVFIETWEDKNASTATALRTEQIAMRFIFMIVVVIAVFPVLAAMIMLVKNKSKDIAILRTIGATKGSVLRIFLMSGAAIGFLGTAVGLILGIVFCLNIASVQGFIEAITGTELFPADVYGIDHLPVKIVPMEVAMVALWGFLISTLATFFPALSASRTDPVDALRYE